MDWVYMFQIQKDKFMRILSVFFSFTDFIFFKNLEACVVGLLDSCSSWQICFFFNSFLWFSCYSNIADLYVFTGEKWSSYCLSSLTARNICTGKTGNSWAQWDSASFSASTGSSCSFLHTLAGEGSSQHLPAAARNPHQAIFTVDASTTEVPAALSSPKLLQVVWEQAEITVFILCACR